MSTGDMKTEHSGAKKAKGAHYGHKRWAKQHSKKKRRRIGKEESRDQPK